METPALGTPLEGGFFAGRMTIDGAAYNLIAAPKTQGEHDDTQWNGSNKDVSGATSYFDGMANTVAMAQAGSDLALWVRNLIIDGFDDWYIPSQDELEILYRAFKPTKEENSQYARSGINLIALPPTRPYTLDAPEQTSIDAFKEDGDQAFDDVWYWSSTQHSGTSDSAWSQHFTSGTQDSSTKYGELRARAVRRSLVI